MPRKHSHRARTSLVLAGFAALLLGASGCSSLRYADEDELWTEGDGHFDAGRHDDAIPYYDELVRRDENEAKALLRRAISAEREGNYQGALRDYAKAGSLGDTRAWLYRANLNISTGALGEAEADLTRLANASLQGRDQVIQLTLVGTLRLAQGQHQMAAQSLQRAVEMGGSYSDPDTRRHVANAHYNAAEAYYHMGDFSRAYDHMIGYASKSGNGNATEQSLLDQPATHLSGQDNYMLGLLAYLNHDFDAANTHFSRADAELVAQAREEFGDPTLGTTAPGGVK
jgi:tetratricopeptide (TPR) repeat protein